MSERTGAATHPAWADRGWYLVTQFRQSPAERWEQALRMAQAHAGYVQILDEQRQTVHRNLFRRGDADRCLGLLELVGEWQGTELFLCGDPVTPAELRAELRCFCEERQALGCNPSSGSVPLFIGCPRSGVGLWITTAEPWYLHATQRGGAFEVHKGALQRQLERRLAGYRRCPNLDLKAAEAIVGRLPDTITPGADRRWSLRGALGAAGGVLQPASASAYYDFLVEHLYS